jgi:hypothetical protein
VEKDFIPDIGSRVFFADVAAAGDAPAAVEVEADAFLPPVFGAAALVSSSGRQ